MVDDAGGINGPHPILIEQHGGVCGGGVIPEEVETDKKRDGFGRRVGEVDENIHRRAVGPLFEMNPHLLAGGVAVEDVGCDF